MARKTTRATARRQSRSKLKVDRTLGLEVVHPYAAGIDIGNDEHYIAVPSHLDSEPVRTFPCFTADLNKAADWLKSLGVTTVALQSTGVYWLPLYDILQERGIEVYVVNARTTKNVPGRKSDVQECQWILKLHVYGLLQNSFRPEQEICAMRTIWRQRQQHVADAARCIQRMQKALTQMNIQLANVISDITGASGQAIIGAIVSGERDPKRLAQLCECNIKASRETVAKSLEGNWRHEQVFVLQQEFNMYRYLQGMIQQCDAALWEIFSNMEENGDIDQLPPRPHNKRPGGNAVTSFDLRKEQFRIAGVDLTAIDGINIMTAQTIFSEIGVDVDAWKTEAHFVSWLNLAPRDKISGGRVIGKDKRKVINRAGQALRIAASTLGRSQSYLGAQYRRLQNKLDSARAIKAMAAKLARIIYRLLKFGQSYVDRGAEFYEQKYRTEQIQSLSKRATRLGFQLAPIQHVAS